MKYSKDEAVSEIMKRSKKIKQRVRRIENAIISFCGVLCMVSVLGLGILSYKNGGFDIESTAYGSFLIPGVAGGYVLAAVIAFVLGVTVTLIILWRRHKNSKNGIEPEDEK
ncbi:MAG: hypothetical protein IJ195_01245 [Lachnospiraceae bacterium]|nr:hypothetical protein [Lachnospiraceae bacterium]